MVVTQHQVGRFEIRDFLGRGAIGDVYLAWDPERQAEVALKLIRVQHADPEMLQAEKNGIAIQAQLAAVAPQVAAVFEQGEDGGFFWVAMEYVAGRDLSEALARSPFSETRAVLIARQLCAMLEICHRFSAEIDGRRISAIVHGDIKPENLRLQENDRVRVLDFGIAKHLSQTRRFTVNLFGSLPYTPPERLDRGAVDRHSDLWAVGVVLYLMLCGRPPYDGGDPEELEHKIRHGEPPAPLPGEVSPRLKKIVYKSLAFDVARRYPSAAEMKLDLEAWLEGLPLPSESSAVQAADGPAGAEQAPAEAAEGAAQHVDLNATRRTGAPLPAPERPATPPIGETRRTVDPSAVLPIRREIDATRRTTAPGAEAQPPVPEVPLPPAEILPAADSPLDATGAHLAARSLPQGKRRWRLALLIIFATAVVITQAWVRSEAREIQHDLMATPDPDLDAVLDRYEKADRWTLGLGIGLGAAKEELRSALDQRAERILDSYHGDNGRTTEKSWQRAQHDLRAALELQYDRETRARMIYCQAHLDRIASQTLRANGQKAEADKKIEDAIAAFRDAARRAPDWPDPYLGLARVYSYERFDLDALQKALGELGKRGYPLGRREKAMLADGFRRKGIELQAQAAKAAETDDRLALLERARDDFNQALSFYADIPGYASSRANRADVEEHLHEVETALDHLHEPGVLEKLLGF